jgi:phospholipid/cholesterol/gamma-HCH transport system ATP-binding protein
LRPDDGEVHFDGARIDRYSERQFGPVRLQVALVFQMSALFDSLTVYENLEFPLAEHSRLSRRERDERIQEALATVDLAGVEQKLPSQLSGGQRKRVALARAIVMRPRVVLYDEPTTGLDPVRADGINELILKLQRTLGVTSVVVTHDLVSAKKIADRVVVLQHGVLAADGTYAQIENHPDPAVQRFMAGRYDPADSDQVDDPTAPDPFALKERASS